MDDKNFAFLKELVETPSPSGFEQPAQRILRRELEGVADELRTDVMGNLIARIGGAGQDAPRVMLAGHCDEIGLMVKYIDDNGYIFFAPIGGVDPHLVPGQRVYVHTAGGRVLGVVGKKPIHMIEAKDRETVIKLKNQFIDIGSSTRAETQALVAIGDPVTFAVGLERLQGDRVTSRAFDDKMGAYIVARVLQEVRRRGAPPVELFGVSTVQEEVGLRGGTTSAYGIDPDVGIAVEVGFATDYPEMDKKDPGDFKVGGGPIIARGPNINPALFELLMRTAREDEVPCQVMGAPRATGTDANVMQLTRAGVAAALVSVPLRYMHTPSEVLSLADLENTVRLLAGLVYRIEDRKQFIPN
ncbi:hydrolase [Desulfuromonas versatilis]|uniref:Hydrolase n=1 Tax=Desulfuromonas versatilis TaxID=2802975 RepID=A0ABM8HTK1_9BACT|nr:M42 family metallopeptidase [Desulfuromonas versatilis]BCR05247.1 hydrolase [Desulfuromonas versatilis]